MSSYSGLERGIARLLARFPTIKRLAKWGYSRLVYLRARRPFRHKACAEPIAFCEDSRESFFGYYDKSPQNGIGWVLVQISDRSTEAPPSATEGIELVVFDAEHQPLLRVHVTAYNWQQGCRAHWLTDDLFIFNDFDGDAHGYVARVFSVEAGQEVTRFNYPVQDSCGTGYFLSLNYQRLMTLRPDYGYRNLLNLGGEQLRDLQSDGIWKVDFQTGDSVLLVSLAQACAINPAPEFEQAVHKFNHVMISPSGQRFIVMHRYLVGQRRFDRLLLADATTGELSLLSDDGMVSHCFWADDQTILGFMRGPGGRDGYWLIDLKTGNFTPFAQDKLAPYGDGHPHVCADWFVTDTYPDKARMQHLLLCNWKTGEVKEIGEFFHGFDYAGECRCDLHPRFAPDGQSVYFDSVFSGKRKLYRMDIAG